MLFNPALLKCILLPHMTCISSNENYPCKSPTQLTVTVPGWQANLIHVESFSIRWLYSSVKLKLINLKREKKFNTFFVDSRQMVTAAQCLMAQDRVGKGGRSQRWYSEMHSISAGFFRSRKDPGICIWEMFCFMGMVAQTSCIFCCMQWHNDQMWSVGMVHSILRMGW